MRHYLMLACAATALLAGTHVPYKGAAPAVVDVMAGQINGMFVDLPVISPHIKAGRDAR